MLANRDIVCLAGCEWGFTWQPTQEIMLRLARAGNRVLYVEPTGTRNLRLSDWRRILRRFGAKVTANAGGTVPPPSLSVYTPLVLPFPYSRLAGWLNRKILQGRMARWIGGNGSTPLIFWIYFPSPLNLAMIRCNRHALAVYQVMSSAEAARPHPGLRQAHQALLAECDLVFANSRRLLEEARQVNPHAHLFRAGVNLETFERGRAGQASRPAEMEDLLGPIVGYIGALHEWVDVDLLAGVARAMPDCRFVLVGPVVRDVSDLRGLSNVKLLGQRPHQEIPRYVEWFDVCVVPYVRTAYTETAYPAKLNEYLALGRPVVATPLPELVDYNKEYGQVLRLAGDAESFAKEVRGALTQTTAHLREDYRAVARENSWARRVEEMAAMVEASLARRR